MTLTAFLVVLGAIISGGITALVRTYRFGPFIDKGGEIESFPEPLQPQIVVPPQPAVSPSLNVASTIGNDFSNPKAAYHSTRVICDEMGATIDQKNRICGIVYQESEFKKGAIGKPNKNGTIDYGIAQFNNGSIRGVPLWIGKGAAFASKDEVLNDPEKCIRLMIKTCLAGHWDWWSSYSSGAYEQWLKPGSPMWLLGV